MKSVLSVQLHVDGRFNGPPGSGNGGYCSGLFSSLVDTTGPGAGAEVTLRKPPPLDAPLTIEGNGNGSFEVYDAQRVLIAQAQPATVDAADVPEPVSWAEAVAASEHYRGFAAHPFPTCFVCGPLREDGLRLFPGPLADKRTAAPWRVPDEVTTTWVWAALDCPGGWSVPLEVRPYVLGRIAARVAALPRPGDECVVIGEFLDENGRKAQVRSAVFGPAGELLAHARATWIAL